MSKLQVDYGRGDVLADKYEIVDRLDESPLGVCYRARHQGNGSYVRLLLLDPRIAGREHKAAIIDAFKLSRDVEHRSLLKIGELGQHAGVAFVTMEDFEGTTLRELMQQRAAASVAFTLREAAQITIRILEAAQVVQDKGHLIRGIRPEYVLVSERRTGPKGSNVVLDVRLFGTALWTLVPPGMLAEDEFTRGDAQYLAPELKLAEPTATPQSDVFSCGVIFYELLVGRAPVGTYQQPRQQRPDLPPHVDDVVELAMAPAPADRYPSPADFIADIQRTFQGTADDTEAPPAVSWVVWALGALLVAAVAVLLVRQSSVDAYEQALAADNMLRKSVYESTVLPPADEVRAVLERHPPNMMYVPPGAFVAGRLEHERGEMGGPKAAVIDQPGFLIDVFEYPNLRGAAPRFGVTWNEAKRLCDEQGKRLCTAEEFEKACRGPENYVYSYGDTFDPDFCGNGIDDIHPSGHYPECKSSWGVYDIAGNFREWTSSERGEGRRLVKGGLPQSAERGTRCAFATDLSPSFGDDTLSFRCCRDVDAGEWRAPSPEAATPDAQGDAE